MTIFASTIDDTTLRGQLQLGRSDIAEARGEIANLQQAISGVELALSGKNDELKALADNVTYKEQLQADILAKQAMIKKQQDFVQKYELVTVTDEHTRRVKEHTVEIIRADISQNQQTIVEIMSEVSSCKSDQQLGLEFNKIQAEKLEIEGNISELKNQLTGYKKYLRGLERSKWKPLAALSAISGAIATISLSGSQLMDTTSLTSIAAITGIGAFVSGAYNAVKKGLNISPSSHAYAVGVGAVFAGATAAALPELSEAITSGYDMLVNFFNSLTPPAVETTILDQVMYINLVGSASEPSVMTEAPTLASGNAFSREATFTTPEGFQPFAPVTTETAINDSIVDVAEDAFSIDAPALQPVIATEIAELQMSPLKITTPSMSGEAEIVNVQASTFANSFNVAETLNIDSAPNMADITSYPELNTNEMSGSFFKAVAPLQTIEPLETIGTIAMNDPSTFPMNNPSTFAMDEPLKFHSAPSLMAA